MPSLALLYMGNEVISLDEIINKYDLKNTQKSSSIFSYDKLNFFNNHYIRLDNNLNEFIYFCKNNLILNNYYNKDKEKILRIFNVYKNNLNFYEEILKFTVIYFDIKFKFSKSKNVFDKIFNTYYHDFINGLDKIKEWTKEELELYIKNFLNYNSIKFPIFGKPIRFILTNSFDGPSISDIFFILGKKESMKRLNNYEIDN